MQWNPAGTNDPERTRHALSADSGTNGTNGRCKLASAWQGEGWPLAVGKVALLGKPAVAHGREDRGRAG